MYITTYNYLIISNNLICYTESNFLLAYTSLILRKYAYSKTTLLEQNYNYISLTLPFSKLNSLINKINTKKYLIEITKKVRNSILNLIKEAYYGSKGKIKLVGRGYKLYNKNNNIIFKLGYSHSFSLYLIPNIKGKFKKKRKKYYIFYGNNYVTLNNILQNFSKMRIPDTYTRKGVFHRKVIL